MNKTNTTFRQLNIFIVIFPISTPAISKNVQANCKSAPNMLMQFPGSRNLGTETPIPLSQNISFSPQDLATAAPEIPYLFLGFIYIYYF